MWTTWKIPPDEDIAQDEEEQTVERHSFTADQATMMTLNIPAVGAERRQVRVPLLANKKRRK